MAHSSSFIISNSRHSTKFVTIDPSIRKRSMTTSTKLESIRHFRSTRFMAWLLLICFRWSHMFQPLSSLRFSFPIRMLPFVWIIMGRTHYSMQEITMLAGWLGWCRVFVIIGTHRFRLNWKRIMKMQCAENAIRLKLFQRVYCGVWNK